MVKSIDRKDQLRLWKLDPREATTFCDGGLIPPLRARHHPTNIPVVTENTVATFLLTTGPEHDWVTHVRFDRSPISDGVMLASWETAQPAQRRGYAKAAVEAAITWMCGEHLLRHVSVWIREGHLASEAIAQSTGFRPSSSLGEGRTWLKDCVQE